MASIEDRLTDVLRERAGDAAPRPSRYSELQRQLRGRRGRRALAAGAGAVLATATTAALFTLPGPRRSPDVGGGASRDGQAPSSRPTPTLPPAAFRGKQAIAILSGADHGWADGIYRLTVTGGGTLAVLTECYGSGTLSVAIGQRKEPLVATSCAADSASRPMNISTVAPGSYSTYGIRSGAPVPLTVTRAGGDSDQWRVYVQRNPSIARASPSPSS